MQKFFRNASQAFVMLRYLAKLYHHLDNKDQYLNSYIRLEHGTGTGFFGIQNTGSTDCVKERFRGMTDALDQTFVKWAHIEFVSENCINVSHRNKSIHRIEHTRELIMLYKLFEEEFILTKKEFSANDLGVWLIENQIVCFIEQSDQRSQREYDDNVPFSKYNSKIYFNNTDISNYTLDQLKALNKERFKTEIDIVRKFDFTDLNLKYERELLHTNKKHTLPPIEIAVKYHDNELELLDRHYHHKLKKRCDPNDKRWYNKQDADRYTTWKENNYETISMA